MKSNGDNHTNDRRPLGVTILAILFLLGTILNLWMLFGRVPAVLFGIFMESNSAQIFYLFMAIIGVYLSFGFFKLLKRAWFVGMLFLSFGAANTLFTAVIYSTFSIQKEIFISYISFISFIIVIFYLNEKYDNFHS